MHTPAHSTHLPSQRRGLVSLNRQRLPISTQQNKTDGELAHAGKSAARPQEQPPAGGNQRSAAKEGVNSRLLLSCTKAHSAPTDSGTSQTCCSYYQKLKTAPQPHAMLTGSDVQLDADRAQLGQETPTAARSALLTTQAHNQEAAVFPRQRHTHTTRPTQS